MIATTISGLKFQLRFAEYQLTLATNKDLYQSLIITYKEAIAKLEKK